MRPVELFLREQPEAERSAPARVPKSVWRTLFGDLVSGVITLGGIATLLVLIPNLLTWAIFDGVWTGDGEACRKAGACWAYLREKYPFILFGIYPADERWRPIIVVCIFIVLTLWTMPRRNWTRATLWGWIAGIIVSLVLMNGGVFGLTAVPTGDWGGLPVTILLAVLSLALGFPFAILLALGRRSSAPIIRLLSVGFIEIIRGLPLLSLLFIASILVPIMLPDGMNIDNLFRALVALTFSCAAYLAEVLRGGLQGLSRGQEEASRALGLSWAKTMKLIVLPQAIRNVIPPLTNTAVVVVKNTSLVLVVGLFDLLSAGQAALSDPEWSAPYAETYLFIAFIYFVICYGISRYALSLERTMAQGKRR